MQAILQRELDTVRSVDSLTQSSCGRNFGENPRQSCGIMGT